jgi:hypothetical protein
MLPLPVGVMSSTFSFLFCSFWSGVTVTLSRRDNSPLSSRDFSPLSAYLFSFQAIIYLASLIVKIGIGDWETPRAPAGQRGKRYGRHHLSTAYLNEDSSTAGPPGWSATSPADLRARDW